LSPSIRRVFDLETYLSFKGRIGRQTYWLSALSIAVAVILSQYLLSLLFGFPVILPRDNLDVQGYAALFHQNALLHLMTNFLSILPASAINAKRLKDRGRSPWWVLPIFAPGIALVLLNASDGAMTPLLADSGYVYAAPTSLAEFLHWSSYATTLVAFIELGLLRGTDGPNQYGNDPLA
jgi:uncharacterized membrane protein YhaH (DUF805 family)